MDQNHLIKFITGNLGEDEAKEVRSWINADKANKHEFVRLKNIHAFASEGKHKLQIKEDFLQVNRLINQPSKPTKPLIFGHYVKYAVILIAALFIGFMASEIRDMPLFNSDNLRTNDFYAPDGQISEFTLSDGTRIWLNAGTHIKVPENFTAKNRHIFMEGEAFFEVKKDPSHPFYVKTNDLDIKVLGTSFNVSSYKADKNSEVTLIEGSVGIRNSSGKGLAKLIPGQQLVYEKETGKKIKREIDVSPYEAWRDGKMVFKNESLKEISEKLERWFDVDIIFADQLISEIKFTGTILKNKPLGQVLDVITLSAPIKFNINIKTNQKNEVLLYSLKN